MQCCLVLSDRKVERRVPLDALGTDVPLHFRDTRLQGSAPIQYGVIGAVANAVRRMVADCGDLNAAHATLL